MNNIGFRETKLRKLSDTTKFIFIIIIIRYTLPIPPKGLLMHFSTSGLPTVSKSSLGGRWFLVILWSPSCCKWNRARILPSPIPRIKGEYPGDYKALIFNYLRSKNGNKKTSGSSGRSRSLRLSLSTK